MRVVGRKWFDDAVDTARTGTGFAVVLAMLLAIAT
jgi:hypothetical protein